MRRHQQIGSTFEYCLFSVANLEETDCFLMHKVALLISVAILSTLAAILPAQAEGTQKQSSFDDKKEQKLIKAEAKVKKAQAKVDCIKAAGDMKTLKQCR